MDTLPKVRLPSEKREQATVLPADGVSPAGISAGGKGDAAKCSDVRVPGEGTSLAAARLAARMKPMPRGQKPNKTSVERCFSNTKHFPPSPTTLLVVTQPT